MQFFTLDLWRQLQRHNTPEGLEALREWERRSAEYRSRLQLMRARVTDDVFSVLEQGLLHDTVMNSITTTSTGPRAEITVKTMSRDAKEFVLTFTDVVEFDAEYHKRPDSLSHGPLFEWGYEELSPAEENDLSLAVLFSSGGTMRIRFRSILIG